MLDREFSALIGAPNSIRDEDITVQLPSEVGRSIDDINLGLHVRLSRLMAQILTSKIRNQTSYVDYVHGYEPEVSSRIRSGPTI